MDSDHLQVYNLISSLIRLYTISPIELILGVLYYCKIQDKMCQINHCVFAVRLAKWTSNLRPNEARRRGFSIYQIEATAAIKEDWHPNLVFIVSFQLSHISGQVSGFFPTTIRIILGKPTQKKLNFSMEPHIFLVL